MSLPEIREAELQAFVDGQLPEGRCTAVLAHLGRHPDDIERLAEYARHKDELRHRLEAVDLGADDPTTAELKRTLANRLSRPDYRRWLRQAATIALLLVAGWSGHDLYQRYLENRIPELVIKAAEAHEVFGADRRRPVELTAASTAEMSAWFSSRLGEPVEIPILAAMGLRLIGGRLLAAGRHPMAQLIYEDSGGHRLTLCLSSEPVEVGQEIELVEVGDLTAGYWQDGDLTYALVGETPDEQLIAIASELGAQEPANHL
jgi:anti-sigma factor RsiW